MWVLKECEILGEGLWFLRTWLLPDALPLFASSRSLVFLVAVSLASVVFEGRTHASEWHWAYLQRLDLVVGLPCPDVQRGMCSHFWWEEHKNLLKRIRSFLHVFFLIETKDFQKTSKTTISFSHFNGAEGFLYFWPLHFPIQYTIHLTGPSGPMSSQSCQSTLILLCIRITLDFDAKSM